MKILYVITSLEGGGAQNLLVDVCTAIKDGNEIDVVVLRDLKTYEPQLKALGIDVILVDIEKLGALKSVMTLKKIIKQKNIDILHTHLLAADSIGRLAGLLCFGKFKIISSMHREDPWREEKKFSYSLIKLFNRFTVNCFKKVQLISVAHSVKEHCIKYEGIKDKKIEVVYNFINYENTTKNKSEFVPMKKNKDDFVIVTAARLEQGKGHSTILNALKKVKTHKNIHLNVLGTGTIENELKKLVADSNIENVNFLGFKTNIYDYFSQADLFILASECEGQSIAILEAFYCSVPVLASGIPANAELLCKGKNGVVFNLNDSADLAEKIEAFAEGRVDCEEITRNAKEFCLSLTVENHVNKLVEIYKRK